MIIKHLVSVLLITGLAFSCGDENEDETADTDAVTPTQQTQGGQGAGAVLTPAEGLELVATSMNSGAEEGEVHPGDLGFELADTACLSQEDMADGQYIDQAEENGELGKYAAYFAYCNLTYVTNGPDTTQGAIARVKGILCALDEELEYEGEEQELTLEFSTPCFTEEFSEMVEEMLDTISFDAVVTGYDEVPDDFEGNDGFEKAIDIEIEEIGFRYKVLFTQNTQANTLAVSIRDGYAGDEDKAVFSVFLDSSEDGIIRYEGLFERDSRHVRALLEGPYDAAEETFTSVDNMEFINFEDFGDDPDQARYISVKGNPADGYMAVFGVSETGGAEDYATYDVSGTKSYCYGDGDCDDNEGLILESNADLEFVNAVILDHDDYINPFDWFEDHGPLEFDSISFDAEID